MNNEENFTFSDASEKTQPAPKRAPDCAANCGLASIPASVWKNILCPPFYRRHPVLIFLLVLLVAGLATALVLREDDSPDGDCLALVNVKGPILDIAPTLEWLRKIGQNSGVRGVLLRVDSPGGGAAASQELYEALAELGRKMPIAVSMGSAAASGGLMVAMSGKRIFANASTVTGSIGVRMDLPQLRGLLDKIGIGQETLVTAPYKNAGSYMQPLTDDERAYFEGVLRDMHEQFVDIVAKGRGMAREQAAALANGKIMTGREAQKLGLVDELGGQEAALRWLAGETGVPAERKLLKKPNETHWLAELVKSTTGLDAATLSGAAHSGPMFLYQY